MDYNNETSDGVPIFPKVKTVYIYDDNYVYVEDRPLLEGETQPKNSTMIAPAPGLYEPIRFSLDQEKWIGEKAPEQKPEDLSEFGALREENAETFYYTSSLGAKADAIDRENAELLFKLAEKGVI